MKTLSPYTGAYPLPGKSALGARLRPAKTTSHRDAPRRLLSVNHEARDRYHCSISALIISVSAWGNARVTLFIFGNRGYGFNYLARLRGALVGQQMRYAHVLQLASQLVHYLAGRLAFSC
jgi:hypothetical protein